MVSDEMRELVSYIDRQMGYVRNPDATGYQWRFPFARDGTVRVVCRDCGESALAAESIAFTMIPCPTCGGICEAVRYRNAKRVRIAPYSWTVRGPWSVSEGIMG